jgi:hypothetical protein
MSDFTPGPWRVNIDKDRKGFGGPVTEILADDGETIACDTKYYPTALDPKNAYIIAAAPDLLEALQIIVGKLYMDDYGHMLINLKSEDEEKIKAAIAKATGE